MEETLMVVSSQSLAVGMMDKASGMLELIRAHKALDGLGVPRKLFGHTLSLSGRIAYLNGRLCSARMAAKILGGGES